MRQDGCPAGLWRMRMGEALIVSNTLLWVIVLALCAIVLALVRQIGVLHERIAPAGALMLKRGLKIGEPAPTMTLTDLDGGVVPIGTASASASHQPTTIRHSSQLRSFLITYQKCERPAAARKSSPRENDLRVATRPSRRRYALPART